MTSHLSVKVADISGKERLYFLYNYPNNGRVYITYSDDGKDWKDPISLFTLVKSPDKTELIEFNDKLHIVVAERNGYGVFYSSSSDGVSWTALRKIGEKGQTVVQGRTFQRYNVAMTSNSDTGEIFVTFNDDEGITVLVSDDFGMTFNRSMHLENTSFEHPILSMDGNFLLHMVDGKELQIRDLSDFTGREVDDKPSVPSSDPLGPLDIDIDSDVDQDGDGGTVLLSANIDDEDSFNIVEYSWYLEGVHFIGFGKEISYDLPPGEHNILVIVEDRNGNITEKWMRISIPGSENNSEKGANGAVIVLISGLLIFFILVVVGVMIVIRHRRRSHHLDIDNSNEMMLDDPSSQTRNLSPAKGVKGGYLHPASYPENLPQPREAVRPPLPVHKEVHGGSFDPLVKIDSLELNIRSREVHDDHLGRKDLLHSRSRNMEEEGTLDRETYIEIKELLDRVGR